MAMAWVVWSDARAEELPYHRALDRVVVVAV